MLSNFKPFATPPRTVFRNIPALVLCQRRENSQQHLALRIHRINILFFKSNAHVKLVTFYNRELFISHIKYSMKSDMCRNLAYDCVMEDCMRMDNSPSILRKDGFEFLYDKYKDKIYKDMSQMAKDWELDNRRETILPEDSHKPDMNVSTTTELPFNSKRSNPCTYKYSEKFAITVIIQLHKLYDFNELYNSYNYHKFFRRL